MKLTCKKFAYKIAKIGYGSGTWYLDQLSDEIIWISSKKLHYYLESKYGISCQEYYNIVVYGDINFIPRCPYCNGYRKFWRISSGYYSTCASDECISDSHSESNSYRWEELMKSPKDYKIFCSKLGLASSTKTYLDIHYYRWLSLGNENDRCQFYIATTSDNKFKFGITSNIDQRSIWMGYKNYKILFEGTRIQVGDLEYYIKLNLDIKSEYLDWSDISRFRKAYNTSISQI
jgi:hypothetical protein